MLSYTDPAETVTLTVVFGCYEEVYALQRSLLLVLRAAARHSEEQFVDVDATPVLDLLESTLLVPDQVTGFSPETFRKKVRSTP